jgi:hypothetical protein
MIDRYRADSISTYWIDSINKIVLALYSKS